MPTYGEYHRRETTTQTKETAKLQEQSQEVWGLTPRGGNWPTVQAYIGKIKANDRGIEFTTEVRPHPTGSPFEARWYLGPTPDVEKRIHNNDEYACIPARVVNHQP